MIGINPPIQVMEGSVRRVWRKFNVDKVAVISKGVYRVQFNAMDSRISVLQGYYFFDSKPVIMKPWHPDLALDKESSQSLPIWVQLKLGLKYWGRENLI